MVKAKTNRKNVVSNNVERRMQKQLQLEAKQEREAGRLVGSTWMSETPDFDVLAKLATRIVKLQRYLGYEVLPGQHLEEWDRKEERTFWAVVAGNEQPTLSFIIGFTQGALDVWEGFEKHSARESVIEK